MSEDNSASRSYYRMFDFVDQLKLIYEIEKDFDFSILVEKTPIKRKYTYSCKVLAIMILGLKTISYKEIVKNDLQYVEVRDTTRRKMGTRNTPFFIDGNSKVQLYKNNYIEFNYRNASKKDLAIVAKMRAKFYIPEPRDFVGKTMHLTDDILLDDEITDEKNENN